MEDLFLMCILGENLSIGISRTGLSSILHINTAYAVCIFIFEIGISARSGENMDAGNK